MNKQELKEKVNQLKEIYEDSTPSDDLDEFCDNFHKVFGEKATYIFPTEDLEPGEPDDWADEIQSEILDNGYTITAMTTEYIGDEWMSIVCYK